MNEFSDNIEPFDDTVQKLIDSGLSPDVSYEYVKLLCASAAEAKLHQLAELAANIIIREGHR